MPTRATEGSRPFAAFALIVLLLAALAALPALAAKSDEKVEEQRAEMREKSAAVLERLYQASPSARGAIKAAAGYATFSNRGIRIGVAGGGRGAGLAVHRRTGKETFMRFVEVQAGIGAGIKKYDLIFVFENDEALESFVTAGWEYGGQATAAARVNDQGKAYSGAISVSPGVWVYQLTSAGLAAEVTLKTSKYYRDKSLN